MKEYLEKIKNYYIEMRTGSISYKRQGIKPREDWLLMLYVSVFVVIALGAFSFYFYVHVDRGDMYESDTAVVQNDVKINAVLLKKTVDDINTRIDLLSKMIDTNIVSRDPSL